MHDQFQDNKNTLTDDDIKKLIKSPIDKKMEITQKMAEYYNSGGFNEEQMHMAENMFRALVKDTEAKVRQSISELLSHSDTVPKDVILSLANDAQEISLPVLEFSNILSDIDLIDIVKTSEDVQKQIAISHRDNVSENVSEALIETHNSEVVDSLLHNESAHVSEESLSQITDEYKDNEEVLTSMLQRGSLPISIVENLANSISSALYDKLITKNEDLSRHLKDNSLLDKSSQVATMKMMGLKSPKEELKEFEKLIHKLNIPDDLIPISALCMGNIHIFEISISRITHIPIVNVRTLFDDDTNKGIDALYQRANLPSHLYEPTKTLIEVLRKMKDQLDQTGLAVNKKTAKVMYDKIIAENEKKGGIENIEYITSLIMHNVNTGRE